MDKMESELKDEFETAFRGNSVEEARVLIKLVDRETGHTSHELIKRFKGGFSAFMWQSVALVCGTNLKARYESDGEDKLIEQAIYLVETGQI
jgi:pyruvate dehydrogenase complex dehydrogenase (E1) component